MKIEGGAILALVFVAGCPKGGSPKAEVNDCDDVGAHAERLYARAAAPRLEPRVGRDLFAQDAPPDEGVPMPLDESSDDSTDDERDAAAAHAEGLEWKAECLEEAWTQAQIDCYVASPTVDALEACEGGAAPMPVPPVVEEDPECVAAADQGAIILANDSGAPGDADLMARARAAILGPCLERRYGDGVLECLRETSEHFGTCGFFASGDDWDRLTASLDAAGFSPKKK